MLANCNNEYQFFKLFSRFLGENWERRLGGIPPKTLGIMVSELL